MLPDSPAPQADPLAEFKQAFEKYQKCQKLLREGQNNSIGRYRVCPRQEIGEKASSSERSRRKGLWVSGMAGLFSLADYELSNPKSACGGASKSSSRDRRWTIVMRHRRRLNHRIHALVGRPIFPNRRRPSSDLVAPATIASPPGLPDRIHDARQLD